MPIVDIERVAPDGTEAARLGLAQALAAALQVDAERVHVQRAPPGAGRQAFGGRLVT